MRKLEVNLPEIIVSKACVERCGELASLACSAALDAIQDPEAELVVLCTSPGVECTAYTRSKSSFLVAKLVEQVRGRGDSVELDIRTMQPIQG